MQHFANSAHSTRHVTACEETRRPARSTFLSLPHNMLSADFYRSSASAGLLRGASGPVPPPPMSFTSRTVASFAAGRMATAPSFAAASVREAGFTAFAAKEAKGDWVQDFLKDLAAVRLLPLLPQSGGRRWAGGRQGEPPAWAASRSSPGARPAGRLSPGRP